MTWRTPCTENDPELWVSDKAEERWLALQDCQRCPRLAACAKEAENPDDRIGVRGGTDWTVTKKGLSLAPVTCQNERCGRTILQHASGGRRNFCNDKCRRTSKAAA